MTLKDLRVGFLPLTDAAVLIAAARLGFAEERGLRLVLSRENSWASLRDKLVVGLIEAGHILAPLALATHLGGGHLQRRLAVPVRLNVDGNIIAVSGALRRELADAGFTNARDFARSLGEAARQRARAGQRPLAFAVVFHASSHEMLMRRMVREAGLELERDVRLVVLAPPLMVDALATGVIDGFCAGGPWGSVSVDRGVGHVVATSSEFETGRTEKVLGLTLDQCEREPEATAALISACAAAGRWCADPANFERLAEVMGDPSCLDIPAAIVMRTLTGRLVRDPGAAPTLVPSFIGFGGDAVTRPDPADAEWLIAGLRDAELLPPDGSEAREAPLLEQARRLFRTDLYDAATHAG